MKNEKLGQDPAFPVINQNSALATWNAGQDPTGMNKRFYAACAAMQGMQASMISKEAYDTFERGAYDAFERGAIDHNCKNVAEYVAKMAFIIADELLKQENK